MANARNPQTFGDLEPSKWPGERLGLPDKGPLSIARLGRRVLAIVLDWAAAMLLAQLFQASPEATGLITGGIYVGMQCLFIPTIGGSIGHRIFGMRIVKLGGGWVGLWRPVVRSLLIMLVIPVLVWDSDQRGFHDKVSGTALVIA